MLSNTKIECVADVFTVSARVEAWYESNLIISDLRERYSKMAEMNKRIDKSTNIQITIDGFKPKFSDNFIG